MSRPPPGDGDRVGDVPMGDDTGSPGPVVIVKLPSTIPVGGQASQLPSTIPVAGQTSYSPSTIVEGQTSESPSIIPVGDQPFSHSPSTIPVGCQISTSQNIPAGGAGEQMIDAMESLRVDTQDVFVGLKKPKVGIVQHLGEPEEPEIEVTEPNSDKEKRMNTGEDRDTMGADNETTRIRVNRLPQGLLFKEQDAATLYPAGLEVIHGAYRGSDSLTIDALPGEATIKFDRRTRALVILHRGGKRYTFGTLGSDVQDSNQKNSDQKGPDQTQSSSLPVKQAWSTNTQYPSVSLIAPVSDNLHTSQTPAGTNRPWAVNNIFCTRIAVDSTYQPAGDEIDLNAIGIKMYNAANANDYLTVKEACNTLAPSLSSLVNERALVWTQLKLKPVDSKIAGTFPIWDGIDLRALAEIRTKLVKASDKQFNKHVLDDETAKKQTPRGNLTAFVKFVALMETCDCIDIFGAWNPANIRQWNIFREFMLKSMFMACVHGTMWFYRRQLADPSDPLNPNVDFKFFAFPRWCVTQWEVVFDRKGKAISSRPAEIRHFKVPSRMCDDHTMAFLYKLAVARERLVQEDSIKAMVDSSKAAITARFQQHPRDKSCYMAYIWYNNDNRAVSRSETFDDEAAYECMTVGGGLDEMAELVESHDSSNKRRSWQHQRPTPETRITLLVQVADRYFVKFVGKIIPPQVGGGASSHSVAIVKTHQQLPDMGAIEWPVTMTLIDDPTTYNRAVNALYEMSKLPAKDKGVDLAQFALGAPSTRSMPDSVARLYHVKDDSTALFRKNFTNALNKWTGINEQQKKFVMNTAMSYSGVCMLRGPPGTGKSACVVSAVEAHASNGLKALFTAPSNRGVDAAYNKFKSRTELSEDEYVRFRGAYYKPLENITKDSAEITSTESQMIMDAESAWWELALEAASDEGATELASDGYSVKLNRMIKAWAQSASHPMRDHCVRYMEASRKFHDRKLTSSERHEAKLEMQLTEVNYIAPYYLGKHIKVVFVTVTSSVHPIIMKFFDPQILFLDEAALTTPTDSLIPMAGFAKSIELLVIDGDNIQNPPVNLSNGFSEGYSCNSISLFEKHILNPHQMYPSSMLTHQYRMHPELSDWVSKAAYGGALVDGENTKQESAVANAAIKYFKSVLGSIYNGRRRLAFSVDTEINAFSERYHNSPSICNHQEAKFCLKIVLGLLSQAALDDQAPIQASSVVVLTPYTGQQRLITSLLFEASTTKNPSARYVKVATVDGYQGDEADIVILSLVANIPGDPFKVGFIKKPNQLIVANSRARQFLVIVGNLWPWVEATMRMVNGFRMDDHPIAYKSFIVFRSLMESIWKYGDLVSGKDYLKAIVT